MSTGFRVLKADGSLEEYLHTKVLGVISSALSGTGFEDMGTAEELAQAVTYYIYHNQRGVIRSSDVFAIVKAVLTGTGYETTAESLSEHHVRRQLRRRRIEVVYTGSSMRFKGSVTRWDKSRIVEDLTNGQMDRQTARMIATGVEEKILGLGMGTVSTGLIRELVAADTESIDRANKQLQGV